jgi:hypothetical protein
MIGNLVCFKIHNCFGFSFQGECVVLRDRKLNIAPAIKKQVGNFNIYEYGVFLIKIPIILIFK